MDVDAIRAGPTDGNDQPAVEPQPAADAPPPVTLQQEQDAMTEQSWVVSSEEHSQQNLSATGATPNAPKGAMTPQPASLRLFSDCPPVCQALS